MALCRLNLIKWNKDIVIEAVEGRVDCILCNQNALHFGMSIDETISEN